MDIKIYTYLTTKSTGFIKVVKIKTQVEIRKQYNKYIGGLIYKILIYKIMMIKQTSQ